MKKIFLIIFFANIFLAKAQITFPAKGADWHYAVLTGFLGGLVTPIYTNTEVKYIKDTLFMGKNAAVIGNNIDNFYYYNIERSNTYIYTSNDTVYFYNATTQNKWQVLYNFNCTAGQGWQVRLQHYSNDIDTTNIVVDSVKFNSINGTPLKTLYVTYTFLYGSGVPYSSIIYDRIGDITYMLDFLCKCPPSPLGDPMPAYTGLLCYQDSTFTLYQPDSTKGCDYSTVGIERFEIQNDNIKIYPNPVNSVIQVTVSSEQIQEIKLVDVLGNEVLQSKQNRIDVSNLSNGVYFVQVKTSSGTMSKKIVIQH